ncbi:hypothetical protein M2318_000808 [Metapseudomonas resinovorans]
MSIAVANIGMALVMAGNVLVFRKPKPVVPVAATAGR